MGRKRDIKDIYVKIVEQEVQLSYTKIFLRCFYMRESENEQWDLQEFESVYDNTVSINEHIALMLYHYYGDPYNYELDRDIYYGYCEDCGSYEDETLTICFEDNRLTNIQQFTDGHLGYDSGCTDEEIIEAWKKNKVHVSFEYVYINEEEKND